MTKSYLLCVFFGILAAFEQAILYGYDIRTYVALDELFLLILLKFY